MAIQDTDLLIAYRPDDSNHYKLSIDSLGNYIDSTYGSYLRTDAAAGDQVVLSTGKTIFSGLSQHANGLNVTGGDFKLLGTNQVTKIFSAYSNSSPKNVLVFTNFPKVNSTNLKDFTLYNAGFDVDNSTSSLDDIFGYRAAISLGQSGATKAYGFFGALSAVAGKENFNFYASSTVPNFFAGDTFIGGNTTTTTRELWESLLTEEQKEELAAGTLVVPANVATPGDGEFARQWWYDRQSSENQALIDAGELEYPKHFQAANFVDTFTIGDNTAINLLSNGAAYFSGPVTGGNGGSDAPTWTIQPDGTTTGLVIDDDTNVIDGGIYA